MSSNSFLLLLDKSRRNLLSTVYLLNPVMIHNKISVPMKLLVIFRLGIVNENQLRHTWSGWVLVRNIHNACFSINCWFLFSMFLPKCNKEHVLNIKLGVVDAQDTKWGEMPLMCMMCKVTRSFVLVRRASENNKI